MRAVVDVIDVFVAMVFEDERAETSKIDVVTFAHVVFDGGEEFVDDYRDIGFVIACALLDFFDDMFSGHRSERSVSCL